MNIFYLETNSNADISTQQSFAALENYDRSSRSDIVIELVGDSFQDILFIEINEFSRKLLFDVIDRETMIVHRFVF
ncbi:hypothetical protein Lepto7375DRAFT_8209 [Leptolyngbya sp. PCC 7375]|nr:hypothetical protein Lepto7375DRAFT_8209 [Leptolyngbya sp. PCC 7375]